MGVVEEVIAGIAAAVVRANGVVADLVAVIGTESTLIDVCIEQMSCKSSSLCFMHLHKLHYAGIATDI